MLWFSGLFLCVLGCVFVVVFCGGFCGVFKRKSKFSVLILLFLQYRYFIRFLCFVYLHMLAVAS